MKITKEILEKIDQYIDNALPTDERKAFEILMENDKEIKEAYEINLDLKTILTDKKRENLIKMTDSLGNEFAEKYPSKESKKRKGKTFTSLILIALISLAVLLIYFITSNTPKNNNEIYASFYESYTLSTTERSTELQVNSSSYLLDSLLINQKYNDLISISTLEKQRENKIEDKLNFYEGISFLELGDLVKAKTSLLKVANKDKTTYLQASLWYLSLIALKENDIEQCKSYLNQIRQKNSKGKYFFQATQLLEQLN